MNEYITYRNTIYDQDLQYAKQFLFGFGSNYAQGTKLLPREARDATIILYAFFRYPDELVDNPGQKIPGQTHEHLEALVKEWEACVSAGPHEGQHPIIRSTYYLFSHKNIPFDYATDFLGAMKQDLVQNRYQRYRDLEGYMWGSASVVGHIMTFILGYKDESAFDRARALGEAMQLTNFLRDVDEDYQDRDRIYIPLQDMIVFGVTEDMIKNRSMTPELYNLMRHYVERTNTLFELGIAGIKQLKVGRFGVLYASYRYREYLNLLVSRQYDIFGESMKLSRFRKFKVLLLSVFGYFRLYMS